MKTYLMIMLAFTIIFTIITVVAIIKFKKYRNDVATISGILWAMFSVIITLIVAVLDYKAYDINVSFKDGRMKIRDAEISLYKNNNELDNIPYPDGFWYLSLCNTGNKVANNIKVKITFDKIVFSEQNGYKLDDHRHGLGGYESIIYEVPDSILPDDCEDMPVIDFSKSYIDKNIDTDKMNIYIYTEDSNYKKFEYKIKLENK